jgi:Flagellar hook-length control protein FliK
MSISINPAIPVTAAPSVAPDLVLQPGTVINAQVLKVLSNDLVRIAISNLAIDVLTEVPLAVGQALQLAVSQTPDGIRLALVGQGSSAGTQASGAAAGVPGVFLDAVSLAPPGAVANSAEPPVGTTLPRIQLTPPEQLAVATAVENAATQQESLAPLFANLGVVGASNDLPPQLRQAVVQLLAQRTNLDQNLTGADVKNAFQRSGIFLEASLASGSGSLAAGIPDLKAALIVLRQTLLSSLGSPGSSASPATVVQQPILLQQPVSQPQQTLPEAPSVSVSDAASPHAAVTPTLTLSIVAPSLSSEIDVHEILLPQARLPGTEASFEANSNTTKIVLSPTLNAESRAATAGAVLNLFQEALQELPPDFSKASRATTVPQTGRNDEVTVHTNTPPPPFRGALPSPQPVTSPSIAPHAPLATNVRHLLGDTEAALARQTLLQVASLPELVDTTRGRIDPAVPRWNFEIPFATLQGTAITQFEISRDGGGNESESAKRVWRARFSLDIEPAGPVHAVISLSGERTSVRMWAERPATAAQLRAGAAQLSQALSKAELVPGDIVIRDGVPPQPAPARAGHFLDRAL